LLLAFVQTQKCIDMAIDPTRAGKFSCTCHAAIWCSSR
jgi:hypothetical protein